jgi:hypothetical protein
MPSNMLSPAPMALAAGSISRLNFSVICVMKALSDSPRWNLRSLLRRTNSANHQYMSTITNDCLHGDVCTYRISHNISYSVCWWCPSPTVMCDVQRVHVVNAIKKYFCLFGDEIS